MSSFVLLSSAILVLMSRPVYLLLILVIQPNPLLCSRLSLCPQQSLFILPISASSNCHRTQSSASAMLSQATVVFARVGSRHIGFAHSGAIHSGCVHILPSAMMKPAKSFAAKRMPHSKLSTTSSASSTPTSASATMPAFSASASVSTAARPFRILGLQQVAIGSLSLPALSSLWRDTFGLHYQSSFESQRENVTEHILTLGPHPKSPFAVELDLMQPLNPTASPAPHSPSLNHIGLWVDDLAAAVQWLEGEGRVRLAPGGVRRGASGHDICFIHPKADEKRGLRGGEGVLIELVQAPQSVVEAFDAEARRLTGGGGT